MSRFDNGINSHPKAQNSNSTRKVTFVSPTRKGTVVNSQLSCVAGCTEALSCLVVARGTIQALTGLLAAAAIVTVVTGVLATPTLISVGAHAGASDGIAQGSILALAAVTTVGAPVTIGTG